MKIPALHFLSCLCLTSLLVQVAQAEPQPPTSEAEKGVHISDIVRQSTLYPYIQHNPGFCKAFLADLRTNQKIEWVEPEFHTNDPNDPKLERYRSCEGAWIGKDTPKGYYWALTADLGQTGFRLYHIDVDNNPKNGVEEYIYAESDPLHKDSNLTNAAGYNRVDLNSCFLLNRIPASQARPHGWPKIPENKESQSAIIRYKGKFYVLDTRQFSEPGSPLDVGMAIWNFKANAKRQADNIPCAWDTGKR